MEDETIDLSLNVDTEGLYEDGNTLITNSSSIIGTVAEIKEMLSDANWTTWLGVDSDSYVAALSSFVSTLSEYASEIGYIGEFMKKKASNYNDDVRICVEGMNNNEQA